MVAGYSLALRQVFSKLDIHKDFERRYSNLVKVPNMNTGHEKTNGSRGLRVGKLGRWV